MKASESDLNEEVSKLRNKMIEYEESIKSLNEVRLYFCLAAYDKCFLSKFQTQCRLVLKLQPVKTCRVHYYNVVLTHINVCSY